MTTAKPMPYDLASQKQRDYINRLVSYRLERAGAEVPTWKGYPVAGDEQVIDHLNGLLDLDLTSLDELSRRDASRAIDILNA